MRGRWEEKFEKISIVATSYGYIRTNLAWLFPMVMTMVKEGDRLSSNLLSAPPLSSHTHGFSLFE